jgi:tetratricopeptide (TPR) repeat protein
MGDYASAAAAYARLVETDPEDGSAKFNLGVCRGRLNEWKQAAEAFRASLSGADGRHDALLGLGICLIHDGRPPRPPRRSTSIWACSPRTRRRCSAKP